MKLITFASFKGGAGKTTAAMAVTSVLTEMGKSVALIDADENQSLMEWQETALKADTWSDSISVYEADDLRAFEAAYDDAITQEFDYAIIDTRGGGSDLNNACVVNTNLVIIPSALTTLDMSQALTTFEHVIGVHQEMDVEIQTALLIQRVPVGKLTVDLEALSRLPRCETYLHNRDAFAAIGRRGLLHETLAQLQTDPVKRISASHVATALAEARSLTNDIREALGEK